MLSTTGTANAQVTTYYGNGFMMIQELDGTMKGYKNEMLIFAIQPTYVTVDDPNNHIVADGAPNDGVARLNFSIDNDGDGIPDTGGRCSGSLLPDRIHVLTAGHCVTNANGVIDIVTPSTATFEGDLSDETINLNVAWTQVNPGWDGQLLCGDDIAIVELESEPTLDIPSYPIDVILAGDIGTVGEKFGYGRTGTGNTGDTIAFDGFKRTGQNLYEDTQQLTNDFLLDNTPFGCPDDQITAGGVITYDFDNGLAANDAFDFFFGITDLGLGNDEVMTAPGDSGGPTFNPAREIMGVTSFLLTISNPDGTTSDIDTSGTDQPDASFGEFGGDTRVSFYEGWINDIINSKGEIHGKKFDDTNGNGADNGEPGIAGWQMDLNCDNGHTDSTTTDVDGNYWFLNIPTLDLQGTPAPTTCTVTEETRAGWTPTTPGTAPDSAAIVVNPEDVINNVDFGNFKDVTIMGEKWQDTDADGTDNAEPRLAGWEITLIHESGLVLTTTTADGLGIDPLGKYTFGPLDPEWAGSAQICETVQPGWIPIHPGTSCIDITIESGVDLGAILPDGATDFGNLLAIDAEKTWTETDYNWDEICELEETSPEVFEVVCRPANINNPGDNVLADTLPQDGNDKYLVNAVVHKEKFQNTNPGAFYALTTVDVLTDIDGLTVWENYDDCTTEQGLLKHVSQKPTRNVKVAIAAPNGEVTEFTDDLTAGIGGMIMADDESAHVHLTDQILAGSTVYVLVKFQDDLKGFDTVDGNFDDMCDNSEDVEATVNDFPTAELTVEASLRITNQE